MPSGLYVVLNPFSVRKIYWSCILPGSIEEIPLALLHVACASRCCSCAASWSNRASIIPDAVACQPLTGAATTVVSHYMSFYNGLSKGLTQMCLDSTKTSNPEL